VWHEGSAGVLGVPVSVAEGVWWGPVLRFVPDRGRGACSPGLPEVSDAGCAGAEEVGTRERWQHQRPACQLALRGGAGLSDHALLLLATQPREVWVARFQLPDDRCPDSLLVETCFVFHGVLLGFRFACTKSITGGARLYLQETTREVSGFHDRLYLGSVCPQPYLRKTSTTASTKVSTLILVSTPTSSTMRSSLAVKSLPGRA
jgi:hypothetical protein